MATRRKRRHSAGLSWIPQQVYAAVACWPQSSPTICHELAGTDRPEGDLRCRYQHSAVRIVVSIAHQHKCSDGKIHKAVGEHSGNIAVPIDGAWRTKLDIRVDEVDRVQAVLELCEFGRDARCGEHRAGAWSPLLVSHNSLNHVGRYLVVDKPRGV